MEEQLEPCRCGSENLKQLKPYGVESVQCQDCFVSLRLVDWNRIMGSPIEEKVTLSEDRIKYYEGIYEELLE